MKKGILFEAAIAIIIVFLAFILYAMVTSSTPAAAVKWSTPTYDQPRYMYAGDNGILYSFTGNSIYAIGSDGNLLWNVTIPDKWRICNDWLRLKETNDIAVGGFSGINEVSPTVASDNGTLYVYARPNITGTQDIKTYDNFTVVFAISQEGVITWSVPLESKLIVYGDASLDTVSISAGHGRVYVFHDYKETVIDKNSSVLFTIDGVSDPAAIDDKGYIYTVSPVTSDPVFGADAGGAYDYRVPSGIVNAYDPNGTLYWSYNIGEPVKRQYLDEGVRSQFDSLPLYKNNKLYLPLNDGILAMNRDGTINWVKRFNQSISLLESMPMDANSLYVKHVNQANQSDSQIYVLSPDGTSISAPRPYDELHSWNYKAAGNGIIYYVSVGSPGNRSLADLNSLTLVAYDLKNGTSLWSYPISAYKKTAITLDKNNIMNVFDSYTLGDIMSSAEQRYPSYGAMKVFNSYDVKVLPGSDRVYVSYYDNNYEYPIVLGQSGSVYVMGINALDMNGKLVWAQSTDSIVTAMAERNGTLFYSTKDGKISAASVDLATGLTVAVIVYVFIRFFMAGAVSRARSRLDKNENRNTVLKFIADHPGSTLYEIARGLDMNLGTARYHVLILGINHRVTSQKADNKYVRFFTNSNTFSQEDQVVMSFIRREPTRRVLGILLEKPGMTNVDLSRELDIAESTISKYIKELSTKDIIVKEPLPGGRYAYSINNEYTERVAVALESLKCVQ